MPVLPRDNLEVVFAVLLAHRFRHDVFIGDYENPMILELFTIDD